MTSGGSRGSGGDEEFCVLGTTQDVISIPTRNIVVSDVTGGSTSRGPGGVPTSQELSVPTRNIVTGGSRGSGGVPTTQELSAPTRNIVVIYTVP